MRKVLLSVIICMLMLTVAVSFAANSTVNIKIDGSTVEFNEDYGFPFIDENDRTQVPLRVTMETFGAVVSWDNLMNRAVISYDGITIEVPIGEKYIVVDGEKVVNDTEARIIGDRTYLPIRVVLESLNAKVGWENDTSTVTVGKPVDLVKQAALDAFTKGLDIGQRAYNIALKDMDDQPFDLYDLVGKKVVLAFWTTWCPSCSIEMDNLIAYNALKGDDVEIISINLTASDSIDAVNEYMEKKNIDFRVLMDRENKIGNLYEIVYIPSIFVLDRNGVIVEKKTGTISQDLLKEIIDSIE